MQYCIYQLPISNVKTFMPVYYETVDLADYVRVYSFEREYPVGLEKIFEMLNINHPSDYRARSLSVSDLVVTRDDEEQHIYVVDFDGFVEVKEKARCGDEHT